MTGLKVWVGTEKRDRRKKKGRKERRKEGRKNGRKGERKEGRNSFLLPGLGVCRFLLIDSFVCLSGSFSFCLSAFLPFCLSFFLLSVLLLTV